MRRRIALILMLATIGASGCRIAARSREAAPGPVASPEVAAPGADSEINPHITVPSTVKVSPSLAAVTAPAGWLSQAEIQQKAISAVSAVGGPGGGLTLTAVRPDEPNGLWIVEFATDGRQVSGPHSHPAPANWPKDPVEQRKAVTSDVRILSAIRYAYDGRTGEELLQIDLAGDLPAYPGAEYGPDSEGWINLTVKNATADQVRDWATQLPKYGWHSEAGASAAPQDHPARYGFKSDAWEQATVEITGLAEGVRVRIGRGTAAGAGSSQGQSAAGPAGLSG